MELKGHSLRKVARGWPASFRGMVGRSGETDFRIHFSGRQQSARIESGRILL